MSSILVLAFAVFLVALGLSFLFGLNSNTAPANVGVVQNNNGNQNTSGVRSINSNNANSSPNSNASPGNRNN